MKNKIKCILCNSDKTQITQTIDAAKLTALHKKSFNIDTSKILTENLHYWHCDECDLRFFTLENGEIPSGDNDFYNALNKIDWYYMSEKNEYNFAKKFIKDSTKILEVGCGKAAFTKFIPNKQNYTGLEFSTDAKEMAAKNQINIQNSLVEDFAKTNKNNFDVACSFQVLEHTNNPHSFIKAQIECLNGGGSSNKPNSKPSDKLLIIAVPSEDSFIQHCTNGILNMPPHHISRFSDKCLNNIAKIFDLELLEIYHEKIQNEHIDFYKSTIWAKIFLKPLLIDTSIKRKFVNKFGILGKKFIKIPKNACGHTVVGVYKIK